MSDVPEVVRRPSSPGVVVVTMAVLFPIVLLGVGTPIELTHLLTGEGIIAAIANIIVRAMVVAVVLFYDLKEWHSSRRTTTLVPYPPILATFCTKKSHQIILGMIMLSVTRQSAAVAARPSRVR